jgi:ubiquinone biosynthesis protein UbiJ
MATKQEIRDYFAKFGKEGGKARARNMTAEERSAAARKAVQARWDKKMDALESRVADINSKLKELVKTNAASARKRKQKAS